MYDNVLSSFPNGSFIFPTKQLSQQPAHYINFMVFCLYRSGRCRLFCLYNSAAY